MRSFVLKLALLLALVTSVPGTGRAVEDYRVIGGDMLTVSVLGQPDLSGPVTVRADGTIALHIFGVIPVAGKTVSEIEKEISDRANALFADDISVLVSMTEYQRVFVLGGVQEPGAFPYQPGLDVIRALAIAGGYERTDPGSQNLYREAGATEEVYRAQARIRFAQAELEAVTAELARLESGETPDLAMETGDDVNALLRNVIRLRRARIEEEVGVARRQSELANMEADSFAERRALIQRQLAATNEQLEDIQSLVAQGLARADRSLSLQLATDDYRADELEAGAYEARARQTAARSDSTIVTETARYHQELLQEKVEIEQRIETEKANLEGALAYLTANQVEVNDEAFPLLEPVFEIYRSGSGTPEIGDLTTPIGPNDVLMVRLEQVIEQPALSQ